MPDFYFDKHTVGSFRQQRHLQNSLDNIKNLTQNRRNMGENLQISTPSALLRTTYPSPNTSRHLQPKTVTMATRNKERPSGCHCPLCNLSHGFIWGKNSRVWVSQENGRNFYGRIFLGCHLVARNPFCRQRVVLEHLQIRQVTPQSYPRISFQCKHSGQSNKPKKWMSYCFEVLMAQELNHHPSHL